MSLADVRRQLRLASLPAGAVALALSGVVRRRRGEDPEAVRQDLRTRNAERTRRTLGELKGGALKAGQLLSTVEALFPQDPEDIWRDALTTLQEGNAALPFAEVEPVLRAELGPGWRARFGAFEERAVAAASLGQVHRATYGGEPVAVKVQYPGVREALAADLRTVSAVSRVAALVARGLALPPLVAELRDRLTEELDYEHEARTQERFAVAYDGDPDVTVPHVLLATPRVLVSQWLPGTPLAEVARTGSQAERDRAAGLYQLFLVSGPERVGLLHTDPHPGNIRVLADGRLGVLDFGSSLELPGMPATFGRLIAALLADDPDLVLARLREEGFVRPGADLDVRKLVDYMGPFSVPARHENFRFGREWLRGEFGRVHSPRDPDFAVALQLTLPAEHLFTHRVWLSMVGVLCQLEATVPVRPVLERWLPGFARAGGHGSGATG
ncbi:MAG TPA: AarF/ABC1/UbiB kinase family protein [Mycobacteriales bacterium]|nr:AarF/ABC1/UbiB kinase family protein [Mycobacteriales bacterium]